ncbi:myeloperoxidase-like [Clavelina lepadiformis]|uniref:myeloperoxidase-like n=1 Tax=Clavelina lepadiformis TaxID=159417 RepID=UPI0040411BE5
MVVSAMFSHLLWLLAIFTLLDITRGMKRETAFMVKQGWFAAGNGFQYKLTSRKFTYQQAKAECIGWGGHLAQYGIRDRFFFEKVSDMAGDVAVWIGLDDLNKESKFVWNDGMPIDIGWMGAWHFLAPDNERNEDCVAITSKHCGYTRKLDDVRCSDSHFGLCEMSIGSTPDYLVTEVKGYTYALITSETMYEASKRMCEKWGGKLATKPLYDSALAKTIVNNLYGDRLSELESWVGLDDIESEGTLLTALGKVASERDINWSSAFNSDHLDCASFEPQQGGAIRLRPCYYKATILCEKPSVVNEHQMPSECLVKTEECQINQYRRIDGTCNNPVNQDRGRVNRPFKRMLPASYEDGLGVPRGGVPSRLPSPRAVVKAMNDSSEPHSLTNTNQLPLWGQFLAHDLTKLGELKDERGHIALKCPCGDNNPECFNIPIPVEDPVRVQKECYSFVRAEKVPDLNCGNKVREQENRVTSYIDASNVYGSTEQFITNLRSGNDGQLIIGNYTYNHYHSLPSGAQVPDNLESKFECEALHFDFTSLPCFAAGDIRVNEQSALTSGHITWQRKHNQIAAELKQLNPHWNDAKLFEVTRHIIAAIHQQITYNEFLPNMLGEEQMKKFGLTLTKKGYWLGFDTNYDATIDISFATAAFRLGHTLINAMFSRPNPDYSDDLGSPSVDLRSQFFDPTAVLKMHGTGAVLRGMVRDHAMKYDTQFPEALVNHLFARAGEFGKDLPSINLQRGRDHGIPSYMEHRRFCGLSTAFKFEEMEDMPEQNRKNLAKVYSHPEDIDLFAGGVSEVSRGSGIPGPTFTCLLAYQFRDLKKGDRFWFENGGSNARFTYSQLEVIKSVSLARILCDVGENITTIQPRVMEQITQPGNARISCSSLTEIDLTPFRETDGSYETLPDLGNDKSDYQWTSWFPITIYEGNTLPLKPASAVLRFLRVYRPDAVCDNILANEMRKTNGFYQIRFKCLPGTIKETDYPYVDSEEAYWTKWSDQSTPTATFYDDDENLIGAGACLYPVAIQAQTVDGTPALETGEVFEMFNPIHGLLCKGIQQEDQTCEDYRVRYLCLKG